MQFGILGPVEARVQGESRAVGGPRVRALLALLLLDAGRLVTSERLIDGLYGEEVPEGAANALQSQVSRLRRGLGGAGFVEGHPAGYRLVVERDDVDVHRFERLAREGRQALGGGEFGRAASLLREALGLWRGAALADVGAPFAEAQVARLEEARAAAVEDRAEAELALGQHDVVLGELRELVGAHPLRERARGLLMRALYAGGRQGEALAVFEDARRVLAEELGADPSAELAEVHMAILRGEASAKAPVSNLPAQLTSFVGREEELKRVGRMLGEGRLVTLLGPGGAGKTRLAIEAGQREPGEVCFVDLSPLGEGWELPRALFAALGLREHGLQGPGSEPSDPVQRLTAALAGRSLLLILDNCEHVIADAAQLTHRLLAGCPGLRVLATSREALGITGETLRPLPPLPLPPARTPVSDVLEYPAVRLFAERASAVRPDFVVTDENLGAVLRICGALDGLPLAIELAAARLRSLPVGEVSARLDDRFRLLSRGNRTAAPRHQTLRAVVEWSWDLLDEDERALTRRLTVFSGGWTLETAARVCGMDLDEVDDLLIGLTDKSLVQADDGGRYRMLETVRAFGAERLAEAGEQDETLRAHAGFFLEFAQQADPELRRAGQLDWMARLGAEHGNLQAALRWFARADPSGGLRMLAAMSWYAWLRGLRSELGEPAAQVLREVGTVPPEGLAEEYVVAVVNARAAGTLGADVEEHLTAAAAIADGMDGPPRLPAMLVQWAMINPIPDVDRVEEHRRRMVMLGDPWLEALDLFSLAYQRLFMGHLAEAGPAFTEAIKRFRRLGDRWGIANTLDAHAQLAELSGDRRTALRLVEEALVLVGELGALEDQSDLLCRRGEILTREGDMAAARLDYERAAERAERAGVPQKVLMARQGLGDVARLDGDAVAARALYEEVLAGPVVTWGWDGGSQGRARIGLGWLALDDGEAAEARALFQGALDQAFDNPHFPASANAAEGLAGVALAEGDGGRAALLLGAAEAMRGASLPDAPDQLRVAAEVRALIGAEAFAAAHARGTALPYEEALALARS
ncbi:ATP-binding protein [Actinomadura hibisca]|uniref:ATP-binding protein n=1 Tax=Actinomadura hibisca TaxID=68565 RepID=UPI00082EB52B|nr:BTAD domain-containing putative transcriptional regulator [Actinomadura hibisca]